MNTEPQLDPRTVEIAMGVRREASVISDLQRRVNQLRTRVSGIDAYQDFVDARSGFDDYETELTTRAADYPDVDDSDIATARDIVESAFADFDTFTGDPSGPSGIFAQADFDAYRTYLTDNGVSESDSDRHLQPIKKLFVPDNTFIQEVDDSQDYSELEQWLQDNGFGSDEASDFITKLKNQFDSFADFQAFVDGDGDLEQLLNEFDHGGTTGDVGQPGIERRDGNLILVGEKIRNRQPAGDAEAGIDPPDSLDWTMESTDETIDAGDSTVIVASASASTDADWVAEVSLVVDDEVTQRADVSVTGGNATVSFPFVRFDAGAFDVRINNSSAITITVEPTTNVPF